MDENLIERAEQHQEFLRQQEIKARRDKVPKGIGPEECECGESIPERRRQAGYDTCITCAQLRERQDAQRRR